MAPKPAPTSSLYREDSGGCCNPVHTMGLDSETSCMGLWCHFPGGGCAVRWEASEAEMNGETLLANSTDELNTVFTQI